MMAALATSVILLLSPLCLGQQTSAGNSSVPTREGWQADGDTRSSLSILWSSLATIFACTWTVLHLNTPGVEDTEGVILRRKIAYFISTILAPECTITGAVGQWLEARRIGIEFRELSASLPTETSDRADRPKLLAITEPIPIDSSHKDPELNGNTACNIPWTMTHGFLATMGGLIVKANGDGDTSLQYSVLFNRDVAKLAFSGDAVFPELRIQDIKDKSKADSFAKLFAMAPSLWLVINISARAGRRLPVTPIEFITLGYVLCALLIYVLWWYKPKDLMVPLVIRLREGKKIEDYLEPRKDQHRKRRYNDMATAGTGFHDDTLKRMLFFIGVVYGAVHIAAWDFDFESTTERVMWQVCSVFATVAPLAFMVSPLVDFGLSVEMDRKSWVKLAWRKIRRDSVYVFVIAYMLSRAALIVLAFTAMRSLPTGCYDEVNWVGALPHF